MVAMADIEALAHEIAREFRSGGGLWVISLARGCRYNI